jgi:hypothetical protein
MAEVQGALSSADQKAAETIQKLLNLAAKAGTPAEAETAMAKAQELMAKHNLDQATVEGNVGQDGKREKSLVEGGFYAYVRELWQATAELNFCLYWSQKFVTKEKVRQTHRIMGEYVGMRMVHAQRRRHALVGRMVNVRTTITMAQYLQAAVERILREEIHVTNDASSLELDLRSNWAHSFRQGCAKGVIEKLQDRREEVLAAERQAQRRAERKASGASTSKALALATFTQSEEDANADFLYGEGWSVKKRAERVERAEERRRELAEWTQWCKDHPEEAAKQAEDDRKREERNAARRKGGRFSYGKSDNRDLGAYYSGKDAAAKIGIDPQTDSKRKTVGRITGSKDIQL